MVTAVCKFFLCVWWGGGEEGGGGKVSLKRVNKRPRVGVWVGGTAIYGLYVNVPL